MLLLITLSLYKCTGLRGTLDLNGLNQLQSLDLSGCTGLTALCNFQELHSLLHLNVRNCPGLAHADLPLAANVLR